MGHWFSYESDLKRAVALATVAVVVVQVVAVKTVLAADGVQHSSKGKALVDPNQLANAEPL